MIETSIRKNDGEVEFVFTDNGIGISGGIDVAVTQSLGLKPVTKLIAQIGGMSALDGKNGTSWVIRFPFCRGE